MTNPNARMSQKLEGRPVAPHFKVGGPDTHNVLSWDDLRRFYWKASAADADFADMAGWDKYVDVHATTHERGCLTLPLTTRSAGAVLSGMQAWSTEKEEVVKFMSDYVRQVYDRFGGVDEGLSLDSLGVTRGNEEVFVLPPHGLQTDPEYMQAWANNLYSDLDRVLGEEEQRDHLVDMFMEATSFVRKEA